MAFLNNKFTCFDPQIKIQKNVISVCPSGVSATSFQIENGDYWYTTSNVHFIPLSGPQSTSALKPDFSECDNFKICIKFKNFALHSSIRYLLGTDIPTSQQDNVAGIPQIYIPANSPTLKVDLFDENDNLETLSAGGISADEWHYAVLVCQPGASGSDITLYLFDESGVEIGSSSISDFKLRGNTENRRITIGGFSSSYSGKYAKNIAISATESFVEVDGELLWGGYNSISANF